MSPNRDFDIVIIGGGLVGAALACALAPTGLAVALVEARAVRQTAADDQRSTALAHGSRKILEGLQVWSGVSPNATPIRRIHISHAGWLGATRLSAGDYGIEALGYVVENRLLGAALWRRLRSAPGIEIVAPACLTGVEQDSGVVQLTLAPSEACSDTRTKSAGAIIDDTVSADSNPERIATRLVVAADGARSAARGFFRIEARTRDYSQCAVVTTVTPARAHDSVAYERFTDDGPLAFLPLPNGQCSVVWTLSPAEAALVAQLDETAFLARLQEAFGYRLGALLRATPPASFPLRLVEACEQTSERCVLLGNSAHGLHPVAGQGMNLALRDAAVLAEVIADAVQAGNDPGAEDVLERYARWRAVDQRRVVFATDALARLFASPFTAVRAASDAGLFALDFLPPAKAALARHAMGLSGRQPRLARGLPLSAS